MTMRELKMALTGLKAADPDPSVIVRGTGEASFQGIVDVLDLFQQLQITKVGMATDLADAKTP
jgi:biopolymer transport protein ExbD